MSSSILYPYGNNSNNPSRINTRISGKKNGSGGELDSTYAELLSEGSNSAATLSNGILSLSINDQKPRTPMDLIQVIKKNSHLQTNIFTLTTLSLG